MVASPDIEKMALTITFGKYEFTSMSFSLRNAAATFQRLMDHVLAGMEKYSCAYMDDKSTAKPGRTTCLTLIQCCNV